MSVTPATAALDAAAVDYTLHEYETRVGESHAASYGEAVAAELGFAPERVFKTLVTLVDDEPTVALVPVSARLSTKALARAVGGKRATLAEQSIAERLTGYVVGGISPVGQRRHLPTVIDGSLLDHPTVLVNGGKRGIQIEMAPDALIAVTGAEMAPITD